MDTASEPEIADGNDAWLQADLNSLESQGYVVERYSVTGKTLEETEHMIDQHDIFFMCGGNTPYLLDQLQQTGSFELIKRKVKAGKPYIGSSAGAIVAGPQLPEYLKVEHTPLQNYSGFNFVSVITVPHWGSDTFRDRYLGGRMASAFTENQPPLVLLNDLQYMEAHNDGSITLHTATRQ